MNADVVVVVRGLTCYLPWTWRGRQLRPLWTGTTMQEHRPRPWARLFGRRRVYRVSWTRC